MDSPNIQAEIIAVGSELLTSTRTETNSLFITAQLNGLGITIGRKVIVADSEDHIVQALSLALNESRLVVISGGLGPTNDDLTREAVARALGRDLVEDPDSIQRLEGLYRRFGVKMTDNNRRQAMTPTGALVLENPKGTAPGLFLREGDKAIFLLPGPPRELFPMMVDQVVPLIRAHLPTTQRHVRQLRIASLAESLVDSRIEGLYRAYPDIETTILSSSGLIDVLLTWRGAPDPELANRKLDELSASVQEELGINVFADGPRELESVVGERLRSLGVRLATAESCTGGWISKMLTDIPGSSVYFLGGVVSYSNDLKSGILGVSPQTLDTFGAVSEETAREMAAGVRRVTGAELGLAVTGVAGPDGGTPEKPVGTVCFGLAREGGVISKRRQLPGDREAIRLRSARFAIDWLRRELL